MTAISDRARAWRRGLCACLSIAACVFGAARARADETTTAVVRIRLDAPAAITASIDIAPDPPTTTARRWHVAIDRTRLAAVHRLPPGAYTITVHVGTEADGALPLVLDAGSIVSIAVTPAADRGSPRIDIVSRAYRGQGVTFDASDLQHLPGGTEIGSFADSLAPFVVADMVDGGGLATGRMPLVGNRGASWTDTTASFGDVTVGSPDARGVLPFYPDLNAVDGVRIYAGAMPPDIGSPGAAVALAPRRPPASPSGSIDASVTTPRMVSTNDSVGPPDIARMLSWQDVNLDGGGPIGRRAGAFLSATVTRARQEQRGEDEPLAADVASLFGHVVAAPDDHDEVRVTAAAQRIGRPFADRLAFADTDARERDLFLQSAVSWDHSRASGAQQGMSIAIDRGAVTPLVSSSAPGGTIDRVFDGPIPPPPSSTRLTRLTASAEYEPAPSRWGDVRFSLSASRVGATAHVVALPTIAELVDGLPARVWVPSAPTAASDRHVTEAFAAASDTIAAGRRLTFSLGARAAVSSGTAAGAASGATWRSLQPRLGFRWSPSAVSVIGNFAQYESDLSPDLLAYGDPGAPAISVYAWNDANGNRALDPGEAGPLIAAAGTNAGVAAIDPALHPPRTTEFTLGLEAALAPRMTLSFTAIVRNDRGLVGVEDVGVPLSGYQAILVPTQAAPDQGGPSTVAVYSRLPATFGDDRYLLTNIPAVEERYRGLELLWDVRSTHWRSIAGASAFLSEGPAGNVGFQVFENDQGVIGSTFADPNASLFTNGHLFFDRSYVLKWSTIYQSSHGFLFAAVARYQDGQPFSRLIIVPGLAQGPEAISVSQNGTTRFTFTATADVRVEQRIRFGRRALAVRADVFNLTNRANEIEENPVAGPAFRETTAIEPPRTVRVGVHVDF